LKNFFNCKRITILIKETGDSVNLYYKNNESGLKLTQRFSNQMQILCSLYVRNFRMQVY